MKVAQEDPHFNYLYIYIEDVFTNHLKKTEFGITVYNKIEVQKSYFMKVFNLGKELQTQSRFAAKKTEALRKMLLAKGVFDFQYEQGKNIDKIEKVCVVQWIQIFI